MGLRSWLKWFRQSGKWLTFLTLLMLFGCCSSPRIPREARPREELLLKTEEWVQAKDKVTLPLRDLKTILVNRRRWILYGLSLERPDLDD